MDVGSLPDRGPPPDLGPPRDGEVELDFGPVPDVGIPAGLDSDDDGLCDAREVSRGTDRFDPDSDGDGYSDYYEFILGSNALDPSSPAAERIVFLSESPTGTANTSIRRTFTGNGEDFSGAFVPIPVSDTEGINAGDFFAAARATSAQPMSQVAAIVPEEERFVGVLGSTNLGWEVDLEIPSGFLPRGCLRVYPFRYDIKRSDGRFVGAERRYVVIIPVGGSLAESPWCPPRSCI